MSDLIAPILNRNGTSRDSLLDAYMTAIESLDKAIQDVAQTCPNGRDFQTNMALLPKAIEQHNQRVNDLRAAMRELQAIAEAIADQ